MAGGQGVGVNASTEAATPSTTSERIYGLLKNTMSLPTEYRSAD